MTNSGHQNFVAVSSVVGIDITQEHIRLARERVGNLAQVLRGDGTNIPFEDASFDYVYSHGVLHRVDQRRRMVEEIFRVLRPGGRFNVQVYAAWSYSHFRHLQKFGRDWKRHVENSTAPVHIELYQLVSCVLCFLESRSASASMSFTTGNSLVAGSDSSLPRPAQSRIAAMTARLLKLCSL